MSKDLPYFKFYTGEWTNGDITLEDYYIQGLFINICAYYWSKDCELSFINLSKKFKGNEESLQILIDSNIIKIIDGNISISFLNEQLESKAIQLIANRSNGQLGGRPRKGKTEEKPNGLNFANPNESETKPKHNQYKEKERKEYKSKEYNTINSNIIIADENSSGAEYNQCKIFFSEFYLEKNGTEYYFTGKDGSKLKSILKKIEKKVKEKNSGQKESSEVIRGFKIFVEESYIKSDNWVRNNFSLTTLDSKFNEIFTQLKNGTSTRKKEILSGINGIARSILSEFEANGGFASIKKP